MDDATLRAWRKALRESLVARRLAMPPATLDGWRRTIDRHLEHGFPGLTHGIVAFCWPYRNEYDPRFLARRLRERGAVTALPVVVAPRQPLVFREWRPDVELASGVLEIPYPVGTPEVTPTAALVPMNGFDAGGYRLGYGGGFFDRTLAALADAGRKPTSIGVAFEIARIDTIRPQPYDIPMDFVVTERGIYERRGAALEFLGAPTVGPGSRLASPACYAEDVDPTYFGEPD
ncbi:MAG: 5-formyltetrahydrofolate cyclo-ligase [Burkholderiales bacterium]